MRLAPLCCYATDPDTRPDCTLTPVVAFGATRLCASCAARRSTMGKGQRPRPLETPALDVLTWLAAAEHDLRAARHALHAAARRARQRGHSWQVIGDQLGISRQAAQQRFGQDCNQDLLDGLEPWGVLRYSSSAGSVATVVVIRPPSAARCPPSQEGDPAHPAWARPAGRGRDVLGRLARRPADRARRPAHPGGGWSRMWCCSPWPSTASARASTASSVLWSLRCRFPDPTARQAGAGEAPTPVSYTHLTLPTKRIV